MRTRVRRPFRIRVWWVSAMPSSQGRPACLMEVRGAAHLEVNVQGTAGDMMRTDAPITAMGSKGVAAGNIADVYLGSIFEADSQFFIGLDSQRGYKIYTLENPTRVVVDIAR